MAMVDINLDDAQEPRVMPADEECQLRIISVKQGDDKNGNPYIMPRFEVVGEPLAKEFNKFIKLPHSGMDAKQKNNAEWGLKTFFEAFDFNWKGGFDPEDLVGCEGWAILGVEESEQFGEQNFVKKFVAGH